MAPLGSDISDFTDEVLQELGLTHDEAMEIIEPTKIGPTWQTDEDGKWVLPEHTLGWECAGWAAKYLQNDQGTGPWRFTAEQMRFILWWYAVDKNGRFTYRKAVLQRLKGWGKDPLAAVLCWIELLGPSRFKGWDKNGQPVGKPHPRAWVQVTAVNQSQTTNTMDVVLAVMTDKLKQEYGVTPGLEVLRARNGRCRMVAVTSSYRALEGGRTTFTILNETHHWVSGNNGHKMHETISGNTTKTGSRFLCITNAYLPGEDSVAQRMRETYEEVVSGKKPDSRTLYDSLEAHPKVPLYGPLLVAALLRVRGDAVWLDPEDILSEIQDSEIGPARSRRMWLNQVTTDDEALHGPETWDVLADDSAILSPGEKIVLGFDGAKTNDSTALVAIRVHDRCVFLLGLWERADDPSAENWVVPRDEVDKAVREAMDTYDVQGFFADVAYWESYISEWSRDFGEELVVKAAGPRKPIEWDMRSSLKANTLAHEALMRAIFDNKLKHDGDKRLRRHVFNARRDENNYGVYFGKESKDSPRKIDAYAALMLAFQALEGLRAAPKKERVRTGKAWFF